jgi:hypothetical protein
MAEKLGTTILFWIIERYELCSYKWLTNNISLQLTSLNNHEGCNKLTKLSIENGIKIFMRFYLNVMLMKLVNAMYMGNRLI